MYFSTSSITGLMPSFELLSGCPTTLGTIAIENQDQTNETCVRLSSVQPEPISCAYNVDQAEFDQLATVMANKTRCDKVTWPNSTGIGNRCDDTVKKSEGSKTWSSFVGVLSIILLTVVMSTWA